MDRSQTLSLLAFLSIPCLLSLGVLIWGLTSEVIRPRLQGTTAASSPPGTNAAIGILRQFRRSPGRVEIPNAEVYPSAH